MVPLITRVFIAIASLFVLHCAYADDDPCSVLSPAVKLASQIRELSFKKSVACVAQVPKTFQETFRVRIKPQINRKKIIAEGIAYKLLGFIPQDFDYLNCVLEAYFFETGAFYREEKNDFIIKKGEVLELSTATHELTHALQNQQFDLKTFSNVETEPSDALMAKFALIEGDATSVEQRALHSKLLWPVKKITARDPLGAPKCTLPSQLEDMMSFPYDSGLSFVQFLIAHGGYGRVNAAFRFPPVSTSEILHPDRYLERQAKSDDGSVPHAEEKLGNISSTLLFVDRMGEFFIRSLLGLYLHQKRSMEVAAGWKNDWLMLFNKSKTEYHLSWSTTWLSSERAKSFVKAFLEAYAKRFGLSYTECNQFCRLDVTDFGIVTIKQKADTVEITVEARKMDQQRSIKSKVRTLH